MVCTFGDKSNFGSIILRPSPFIAFPMALEYMYIELIAEKHSELE